MNKYLKTLRTLSVCDTIWYTIICHGFIMLTLKTWSKLLAQWVECWVTTIRVAGQVTLERFCYELFGEATAVIPITPQLTPTCHQKFTLLLYLVVHWGGYVPTNITTKLYSRLLYLGLVDGTPDCAPPIIITITGGASLVCFHYCNW